MCSFQNHAFISLFIFLTKSRIRENRKIHELSFEIHHYIRSNMSFLFCKQNLRIHRRFLSIFLQQSPTFSSISDIALFTKFFREFSHWFEMQWIWLLTILLRLAVIYCSCFLLCLPVSSAWLLFSALNYSFI